MNLLLDTHALLWMMAAPERLGKQARALVVDLDNVLSVSAASVWEIAIKISIGKLDLGDNWSQRLDAQMRDLGVAIMPITLAHCDRVSRLPFHHKDPFDRLIIAQSLVEERPIISCDNQFNQYGVNCIW